ncbi:hypothetical protein [Candidatus Similichlamydia epinepheli]|uniref:hypothetical protein n=1 Tax=Candidatus Similichlamydia epinepheli TaxID=1903953 RepID=UPI000D3AF205|nr:hypothetical protein [Candidatus Similichlamydia epinepheli]
MQDTFNFYILIQVDISSTSSLAWNRLIEDARSHVEDGKRIFWELQYEVWNDAPFNEARVSAIRLAFESFLDVALPNFLKETAGFIFYNGSYNSFLKHKSYSEIFATLDLVLPQELERWFLLKHNKERLVDRLISFSELETFPRMNILLEGEWSTAPFLRFQNGKIFASSEPSTTGVCISREAISDENVCNRIIRYLQSSGSVWSVRLIQERFLNEQWDLLNQLVLFNDSPHLQRYLEGFQAAGGVVKNY